MGGFIQLAFAALWLIRGASTSMAQQVGALAVVFGVIVIIVLVYGIQVTAGADPQRRVRSKAHRRSVTISTIIELVAAFVLPIVVIAAGHSDWVLPSIAVTIGPLLLWLDHLVHIPGTGRWDGR